MTLNENILKSSKTRKQNEALIKILLLLVENKYGMYPAEVQRKLNIEESRVRECLRKLSTGGYLDSKTISSILVRENKRSRSVLIPEDLKIVDKEDNEIKLLKKGYCAVKMCEEEIIVDNDGFRVPIRIGAGYQRVKIYKIKKGVFYKLPEIIEKYH